MPAYFDDKTKTWFAKFRYKDWTGKSHYTTRRGFARKKDAQTFEADFKLRAGHNPSLNMTALVEEYLKEYKLYRKASSYRAVKRTLEKRVLPSFGHLSAADIKPYHIKQWQNELQSSGAAESSIRTYNVIFSTLLSWATKYYGLASNPFNVTGKTGQKAQRDNMTFWELEDFNKFDTALAAAGEHIYRVMFNILFYSGCRIGELMALTPEDFDFEAGTINITKQYNDVRDEVTAPKTEKSIRTVTLPPSVVAMIKDLFDGFYDIPRPRPFGYMTRKGIDFVMRRYSEVAGVKRIRIHDLRHSHASLLLQQGINIAAVSKRLGHSTPTTTLNIYAHVHKKADAEIASMLDGVKMGSEPKDGPGTP